MLLGEGEEGHYRGPRGACYFERFYFARNKTLVNEISDKTSHQVEGGTNRGQQGDDEGRHDFFHMGTKPIEGKRAAYLACARTML